jgi:hypothetical protein
MLESAAHYYQVLAFFLLHSYRNIFLGTTGEPNSTVTCPVRVWRSITTSSPSLQKSQVAWKFIISVFSPSYVYSVLKIKDIHTGQAYDNHMTILHHSTDPIICLRSKMSGNISGPDTYNIQYHDYLLNSYYSWDTRS